MSTKQAAIAKAEGMVSGICDLFLPMPFGEYAGLYVEMKRPRMGKNQKGTLTQSQKDFIEYANIVGYKAVVCYGAAEAIQEVKNYLKIKN